MISDHHKQLVHGNLHYQCGAQKIALLVDQVVGLRTLENRTVCLVNHHLAHQCVSSTILALLETECEDIEPTETYFYLKAVKG